MYLPWCSSGVHFTLNLLQRWEAFLSLPSSPPAEQWRFCCLALVHCPHGVGTRDVNVWLHCLQIYSSHVNIAITWQKQYEMNVFVAHLSSHSWEIPNLLTFLAVFWGRVGRLGRFTWREGSFPAAGREMLLSAELLAVTEGLPLLSFIFEAWLLAMQLHSLCLLWLLLSSLGCQKLSQSHFSVPCAGVEVVTWCKSFLRACSAHSWTLRWVVTYISWLGDSPECPLPYTRPCTCPSQGGRGSGKPSWQLDTVIGASCISW